MAADGAAPGPEGGGPEPAATAPQTLLARCVLSAAGYIAGVGTIVVFGVSVCSSVSQASIRRRIVVAVGVFAARCYASAAYVVMRCPSACVCVCVCHSHILSK